VEGKLCRLPVESQRVYSLFTFYIFAKPDSITSKIEWLVFPESNTLTNQYFVDTFHSVGESCGRPFFCSIKNKSSTDSTCNTAYECVPVDFMKVVPGL